MTGEKTTTCDSRFYSHDGGDRYACALKNGHSGLHESHSPRMGYVWKRWTTQEAIESQRGREKPLADDWQSPAEAAPSPDVSEDLQQLLASFRNAIISEEYFNTADDAAQYEQASARRCTAQDGLESLFGRIKEERDRAVEDGLSVADQLDASERELGRIREELKEAQSENQRWKEFSGISGPPDKKEQ